jgi:hypothetical protein
MSTFRWNISEPADNAASKLHGGTVQLDDIKPVPNPPWSIKPPDASVAIDPRPSGDVELKEQNPQVSISKGVLNYTLVVAVAILGFMVVHGVVVGNLNFEKFLWIIVPPLTGLGLGRRRSK